MCNEMNDLYLIYRRHQGAKSAISPFLPRLRELAAGCNHVVEFGVKGGASSSALLLGAERVTSYDIATTPDALALQAIVGERWDYRIEDSRTARVPECDMLFVDSLHTFAQVRAELVHADQVTRRLVFHDVTTFGEVGAQGETGRQSWIYVAGRGSCPDAHLGIRPAIDELMIRDPSWRIVERHTDSHGLLVLERR